MKTILRLSAIGTMMEAVAFAADNPIWGAQRVENIPLYAKEGGLNLGPLFTLLQSEYFAMVFLILLIGVPAVFALHFMVIGPKVFSHDGKKIFAFSVFDRIIHWMAGVAFMILIPTGLVMIFGDTFGGGAFVRFCKDFHGIATILFAISVIPMFLIWVKDMFFNLDDVKWMMIVGGYLSKKKRPIPAGKFNAGQKMWYWVSTLGGMIMIVTGAMMYFMDFDMSMIREMTGLSQIDLLRASAIIHNVLGMATMALFFTHVYMAAVAIKGAIHSMITGYKEEEEVEILHSSWYKKLKAQGKV